MARYSSYQAPFNRGSIETISECQIIDAQDIAAGPIAIIIMPYRMPYGFHAGWVSAEYAPFRFRPVMCVPEPGQKRTYLTGSESQCSQLMVLPG